MDALPLIHWCKRSKTQKADFSQCCGWKLIKNESVFWLKRLNFDLDQCGLMRLLA
jgi:hypothetical protein